MNKAKVSVDTSSECMNVNTGATELVGLLFQRNTAQLSVQLLRKAQNVKYGVISFQNFWGVKSTHRICAMNCSIFRVSDQLKHVSAL